MAELKLNVVVGGVEKSISTVNELEQALRATREELKNVAIGSEAFERLSEQAVNLQREFVNSFKETTNFNKNIAELGQSVGSLASTITAGFTIATSAIGLFGDESEELTQAQVKAQQALALALSATTIATNAKTLAEDLGNIAAALGLNLTRQSTAATVADTVATGADTVAKGAQATATGIATAAQTAFNAALAANPIGLLLVGLTALIGALVLFSSEQETAKSNIDETTGAILNQIAAQKQQNDDLIKIVTLRRKIFESEATTQEERIRREQETAKILGDINDVYNKEQEARLAETNNLLIKEFQTYSKDLIGERQVLVREVAQYDEFGIFLGNIAEYRTESFKVNEEVLADIQDNTTKRQQELDKRYQGELKQLQTALANNTITQEQFNQQSTNLESQVAIEKQNIVFDNQLAILKSQEEFLAASNLADDANFAENLKKTIAALTSQQQAWNQFYQGRLANQLQAQDAQRKAEEAEQKRRDEEAKRAAERAREDRKRQLNEIEANLEDIRKAEEKNLLEIRKLRIEAGLEVVREGETILGIREGILKLEFDIEKKALEDILAERVKEVQASKVLSAEKKDAIIRDLTTATQAEITSLELLFKERRIAAKAEDTATFDEAQARSQRLRQINEILNEEIRFGDQDTFDNLLALGIRQEELAAEQLAKDSERETIRLNEFIDNIRTRENLLLSASEKREKLEVEAAKRQSFRDLQNFATQLESEFKLQSDFDTKVLQQVSALSLNELNIEKQLLESKKDTLTDEERARLALIQARINGENDAAVRIQEITQRFASERIDIERDADEIILQKRLQTFNKILGSIRQATEVLRSDVTQPYFSALDVLTQGINDFTSLQDQEFKTTFEQVAAYATAALNVVQGVISAISQANQASLAQELENFRLSKQEETNILTEQLNNGLISRQQYDAAILNVDAKFRKKEMDAKRKAFEEDKKLRIAQAVIAGLQGAVAAFAGAMTLGPIAGPIVGGILAGLVAALTAVQIAAIASTKFDSGPTQINPPSVDGAPDPAAVLQQAGSTGGFTQFAPGLTGDPTGGDMTGQSTPPTSDTRVYVLESDISAVQRRVQVAESTATFG